MSTHNINIGDWIKIKLNESDFELDGYVFSILSDNELSVGYFQNNTKAIKEDVVWSGSYWKFKSKGPSGSYLNGSDELIVKRGPQ